MSLPSPRLLSRALEGRRDADARRRGAPPLAVGLLALAAAACGRVGYVPVDSATPDDLVVPDATDDLLIVDTPAADDGAPLDVPRADAATCPARTASDYCREIPVLAATPVIDGEVDCGLALHRIAPVDWTGPGSVPATHWSEMAVGWRPEGLYFYVRVHDGATRHPPPASVDAWCGESIEVYFDSDGSYPHSPNYDLPGTMQFIARGPGDAVERTSQGTTYANASEVGPWAAAGFATFAKSDGYALEAFVRVTDLESPDAGHANGALAAGGRVGLDVAVNLPALTPSDASSVCTLRLGQYFLHSFPGQPPPCRGLPFCDVRGFCTAQLLGP